VLNYTGNDTAHYVTNCVEDIKVTVFVCRNVICLNYTGNDTAHYVTNCVDDIKVTVFVCRNVMCSTVFFC